MYTLNAYCGSEIVDLFTSADYESAIIDAYALFEEEENVSEVEVVNAAGVVVWIASRVFSCEVCND